MAKAKNLREELRNDPLAERNPDEMRQARQALARQEDFNKAVEQREHELRDKNGPSVLREATPQAVGFAGFMTGVVGLLKIARTSIEAGVRKLLGYNVQNEKK